MKAMSPNLTALHGTDRGAGLATALADVAFQTADAVVLTDNAGAIVWVNAAFERLTGHTVVS